MPFNAEATDNADLVMGVFDDLPPLDVPRRPRADHIRMFCSGSASRPLPAEPRSGQRGEQYPRDGNGTDVPQQPSHQAAHSRRFAQQLGVDEVRGQHPTHE